MIRGQVLSVNVFLGVRPVCQRASGGHVAWSPGNHAGSEQRVISLLRTRKPKVHDADMRSGGARLQHDIVRLQIAMDNTAGMQSRHARQQLVTDLPRLVGFEFSHFLETGVQSLPLQQSHAQEQKRRRGLVTAENLINGAEVGMNNLARKNDLLLKALRSRGIGCDFRPDDL